MSFRYRPRSLLLRRTSSCSSIQLTGLMSGGGRHKFASKDWTCNDGAPPTGGLLNVPEEGVVPNENNNRRPPPPIILEPSREGAVEHISVIENPDPPCHFCREQTSKPVHENCTRLKIVSRGRWRTDVQTHINLLFILLFSLGPGPGGHIFCVVHGFSPSLVFFFWREMEIKENKNESAAFAQRGRRDEGKRLISE